jgi:hypothetical protein
MTSGTLPRDVTYRLDRNVTTFLVSLMLLGAVAVGSAQLAIKETNRRRDADFHRISGQLDSARAQTWSQRAEILALQAKLTERCPNE